MERGNPLQFQFGSIYLVAKPAPELRGGSRCCLLPPAPIPSSSSTSRLGRGAVGRGVVGIRPPPPPRPTGGSAAASTQMPSESSRR
jgi:hypothetical protein